MYELLKRVLLYFSSDIIKSILNAKKCIVILQDNLYNTALMLGIPDTEYFQHVNDAKHISYIAEIMVIM